MTDNTNDTLEVIEALHWTIAFLYLRGEIGKAELVRKAVSLLTSAIESAPPQKSEPCINQLGIWCHTHKCVHMREREILKDDTITTQEAANG